MRLTPWGYKYANTQKFIVVLIGNGGCCCTVHNSQKSNNNCECFVEFLIRHTNDTYKTHTAREHESERERVSGTNCTCDFILEKGVASEAGKTKTRMWYKSETAKLLAQRKRRVKLFANLLFCQKNKILTIKKQQQRQQPLAASPPGFTQRQILEIEQLSLSHKHTDKHTRTHVMGNNKNKQKAT